MQKLSMTLTLAAAAALAIPAAAKEAPLVKVTGAAAARGTSRVVIGAFNVGFIFQSTDQTATSGGLIGAFGGTTKAKSELVGVTPAMMQAITDAAYADFTRALTAGGYSVVEPAAMFGDPALAKTKGQAVPLDINIALEKGSKGKATYYKPGAIPALLMMTGDFAGSGMSSMGLAMSSGMTGYAISQYARSSGNGVIDVVYLIDFSDQKRPGAFSFGGLKVNGNVSVSPAYSRLTLVAPSGKQTVLTLNQPAGVEGDFVAQSDASSKLDKTSQAAGNVAGGLLAVAGFGGAGLGKTRKFAFTAKPGNYEEGATKAAAIATERMVGQLAALK